jgi:uncharacterized membrane protein
MNWSIFLASTTGAGIELLEIVVIAYAIARSGYFWEAILGTVAGGAIVAVISAFLGTGLQIIPIFLLQGVIGLGLLIFGLRWMRKSVKRISVGYRKHQGNVDWLEEEGITLDQEGKGFSQLNFWIMAKSTVLEMLEIGLVVISLGLASGAWQSTFWGVGLAVLLSGLTVILLHGYLAKVPEVLIKLGAGILLTSFGTFWLGEGFGFDWWWGESSVLALVGLYGLASATAIMVMGKAKQRIEDGV